MGKLLRIVLTIVLIIAAIMWVMVVYRSCGNTTKTDNTELNVSGESDDSSTNGTADSDDLEDLYTDDEEVAGEDDEDEESSSSDSDDETSADSDSKSDDGEEDAEDDEEDTTAYNGLDDSKSTASSGTSVDRRGSEGGEFLVVAGAYVSESNANKFKRRLERKGYDAEVRIFLGSDYHSVIAGAYSNEGDAQEIADELGNEAYVHKKRYLKNK